MRHVAVDDRERAAELLARLRALPDVTVEVRRLEEGDYLVDGQWLFERKRLPDFARALVEGRLFAQAERLAGHAPYAVLLLEGTAEELAASHVRREALQGALIYCAVFLGLPVLRSRSADESVALMRYVADQDARRAAGVGRPGYRPRGKRRRQLFILQGLPGVGPKRARSLLERFGSVEGVITAPEEKLADVEGMGKLTARRVRDAVREARAAYGGAGA